MPEEDFIFSILKNFDKGEIALCAAVVFGAMKDAKVDLSITDSKIYKSYLSEAKKEALDFIYSDFFELWIGAGGLNVNVDFVRESLESEMLNMDELKRNIQARYNGYPANRKKRTKKLISSNFDKASLL